eukprot:m.112507 g.112507  ORF g.112507 m.112507 type:complete len:59 (-) comp21426_c0_seq2:6-182(-)
MLLFALSDTRCAIPVPTWLRAAAGAPTSAALLDAILQNARLAVRGSHPPSFKNQNLRL